MTTQELTLPIASTTGRAAVNGDQSRQWPILAVDLPVLYEDEGLEEMGDNTRHTETDRILHTGLKAHLSGRLNYHVLANLNLHYHPLDKKAYVSPDEMVVVADLPPHPDMGSYQVNVDGPSPILAIEVLSERTYQQQDLSPTGKPVVYGTLGVPEYILVDVSGEFLPERLLLKRLQPGLADARGRPVWQDEQDEDGGVTSQLGFRLIIEGDGQVRLVDADSGRPYLRPDEVEAARRQLEDEAAAETQARQRAEEQAAAEAMARQRAEEQAAAEAMARQRAEEQAAAETQARLQAEQEAAEERMARTAAEAQAAELLARLAALEAELKERP